MAHATDRRSFLSWALFGLGAIFSTILGVPLVAYVLDPLNRKGGQGNFKRVDGILLDELAVNSPKQGVLRDMRRDAWTLYPNDIIGRVWVVAQLAQPPQSLTTLEDVRAFNDNQAAKDSYLLVFTTICPHLGCSINAAGAAGFACPCHNATFAMNGALIGAGNPAPRPMDTLEWKIDETDPDRKRIVVQYQNFEAAKPVKNLA